MNRRLVGAVLVSFLPGISPGQIKGLQYCGMNKTTGELRCFAGLDRCRSFAIHGSCRAERELPLDHPVFCLYQGKAVLWGCYKSQDKCQARAKTMRRSQCYPLK